MGRKLNIAAIVLAAGQSSRMGESNKLLARIRGKTLVRHAVDAALESAATFVVVVTGYDAEEIEGNISAAEISIAHNPDFAEGISTSLKCGILALPENIDGAVICLADMPDITARHLNALISAFDLNRGRAVYVSSHNGQRGNPVLWSQPFFAEMMELTGDEGARNMLRKYKDVVHMVEMPSSAVLMDIDTPEALSIATQYDT